MNELEIVQYSSVEGMSIFFNALEYRCAHIHSEWEILWITDGKMTISFGDSSLEAEEGDLVIIPPMLIHQFKTDGKPCTFLCLQMNPSFINQAPWVDIGCVKVNEYLSKEEENYVFKRLMSIMVLYIKQSSFFQLACAAHCNNIMYTIIRRIPLRELSKDEQANRKKRAQRLTRLLDYVSENYNGAIRLSDFAEQEKVSMNYLSHFVKDCLGQSFQDYVGIVRFNNAKKLIAETELKLTEICRQAGFSDYKYFSNTFKKQCDMTPEEYQRSINGKGRNSDLVNNADSVERRFSLQETVAKVKELNRRFAEEV